MRIAVAALTGILLAVLLSVGVVQLSAASQEDPVIKPLYNYGTR
ncbi:hypothetical protein [Actinomadura craniellae]|nr:hypothetical protein [Actinomadura craniellae]